LQLVPAGTERGARSLGSFSVSADYRRRTSFGATVTCRTMRRTIVIA